MDLKGPHLPEEDFHCYVMCAFMCVSEDDREREGESSIDKESLWLRMYLCVSLCTCSKSSLGLVRVCLYDPNKRG